MQGEEQFDDFGVQNYRPMNRGSKLQARMAEPASMNGAQFRPVVCSIMADAIIDESTKVEKIGKKRVIVGKGRPLSPDASDDSPYAGINIDEIWAPLESASDVAKNKPHVRTLRSRQLKLISHDLMQMIEKESAQTQPLVRLGDSLQMEDPFMQNFDLTELGVDVEVQKEFRDVVQDCVNCNLEFLRQISSVRSKIVTAYDRKKLLAKKLAPFPKK